MTEPIICKNCGAGFTGSYCNQCGEKRYTSRDKNLTHFIGESFHFLTHFEGKFFTSLKTIITKPGKLSSDFADGIRKPYFKPVSFFFLLVILYLLFPMFEGLNMQLKYYQSMEIFGNSVRNVVAQKMASHNYNFEELSNIFHQTGKKTSKILLALLIPFSALILMVFGWRKRKFVYDHLIFATEINSFYLLWGYLVVPLLIVLSVKLSSLFGYSGSFQSEIIVIIMVFSLFLVFTIFAIKRFYNYSTLLSIIFGILFSVMHSIIVMYIYKLILFFVIMLQV